MSEPLQKLKENKAKSINVRTVIAEKSLSQLQETILKPSSPYRHEQIKSN